jgi:hypothetical protein
MVAGFRAAIVGMTDDSPIVICNAASNGLESYTPYTKHLFNEDVKLLDTNTWYNIGLVDTFGSKHFDAFHYDPPTMRRIGRLYYDKYIQLAGLPTSKPDLDASILIHPRPGQREVQLSRPLYLPAVSGYTQLPLSTFIQYEWTPVGGSGGLNAFDGLSASFSIVKLGTICFLTLTAPLTFTAQRNGLIIFSGLPVEFRPAVVCRALCAGQISLDGYDLLLHVNIAADGVLTMSINASSVGVGDTGAVDPPFFVNTSVISVRLFCVSYVAAK